MKRLFFVAALFFLLPFVSSAQSETEKAIGEANELLNKKDVRHSLAIFRKLHAQLAPTDTLYPYVAKGLFESLQLGADETKASANWQSLLDISNEAMQILEDDKSYLPAGFQSKKYFLYENMILANHGMAKYMPATGPRVKLYDAYEAKELPKGIEKSYMFEAFRYNNLDVNGYDYYNPLITTSSASPVKQIYFVTEKDKSGSSDSALLYTMETHVLEKKKASDATTYVFVKRTPGKKKEIVQTSSATTFTEPVSVEKLHKAALQCLSGEMKFDEDGQGKK